MLLGLNSTKRFREFGSVDDYDLKSVRSVYDYPLEELLQEHELTSVGKDFYQMVVPKVGGIGDIGI
jgi:hypothetical protein